MRSFVTDGNFTADHKKQKHDDDVWLSDGEGIMTAREPYATHLKTAKPTTDVCFLMACSITDSANWLLRNIPVNRWSAAFGLFWMPTSDQESRTSQVLEPMLVLGMVAIVHQAALISSRVKFKQQWTIHYLTPASTRIACMEFAKSSTSMILNVNTASS